MKVLSLFDGISCLRVALGDRPVEYLASEIEKNAIKVSKKNYPDIKHIGSVCDVSGLNGIDLLCGGSPCTDLSIAKKGREGLAGERSKLFYEYVRIWKESKPKWFILENVASMPQKDKDIITGLLGVNPIMINASLVSAQNRKRLFWTNIPVKGLPEDRGILLKDILQPDSEVDERMVMKGKSFCLTANYHKAIESNSVEKKQRTMVKVGHIGETDAQANRIYSTEGKSSTLSANGGGLGAKTGLYIGRIVGRRTDEDGKRVDDDKDVPYIQRLEVSDADKSNALSTVMKDNVIVKGCSIRGRLVDDKWEDKVEIREDEKASAITSVAHSKLALVHTKNQIRKLTPVECERLQSLPDNYTPATWRRTIGPTF